MKKNSSPQIADFALGKLSSYPFLLVDELHIGVADWLLSKIRVISCLMDGSGGLYLEGIVGRCVYIFR